MTPLDVFRVPSSNSQELLRTEISEYLLEIEVSISLK
jgi:hypothetical protein